MKKKDEDELQLRRIFLIIMAIVSVIMICIGWKYLLGYLAGCGVSVLVYINTIHYVDETIRLGMPAGGLHRTLNYLMWTAVLIICALLPDYMNILSCALGLFMIRISLLIREAVRRKE